MSGQGAIISQYLHSFKPHFLLCPGLRLVTGLSAEVRNQLVDVSVSMLQPSDSYTQLHTIITEGSLSSYAGDPHVWCRFRLLRHTLPIMPHSTDSTKQPKNCSVTLCVSMSRGQWYGGSTGAAILRRYYGDITAIKPQSPPRTGHRPRAA